MAHLQEREDRHAVVRVMKVDGFALLQLKLVFPLSTTHAQKAIVMLASAERKQTKAKQLTYL
jgi:hypothetical protein